MARKFQIGPKDMAHTHALARSSHSRPFVELQHSLPGQIAAISSSVDMVMSFVSKFRKVDGSEANIEMALHEALANVVVHDSHENPNKRVYVLCRCRSSFMETDPATATKPPGPAWETDELVRSANT